jgi:hypothetical protein
MWIKTRYLDQKWGSKNGRKNAHIVSSHFSHLSKNDQNTHKYEYECINVEIGGAKRNGIYPDRFYP